MLPTKLPFRRWWEHIAGNNVNLNHHSINNVSSIQVENIQNESLNLRVLPAYGLGTWVKYPNAIVEVSGEGWDSSLVADPDVIFNGHQLYMFYNGSTDIGYATSRDGINWTKYGSNPVLSHPGEGAVWDEDYRCKPCIVKKGGTWYMFFIGDDNGQHTNRIGYATSSDLNTWTPYGGNPILSASGSGWDDQRVDAPFVIEKDGTWYMFYTGQDADSPFTYKIGVATSNGDFAAWTKHGSNPILTVGAGGQWDDGWIGLGSIIKCNDLYIMTYTGSDTAPTGPANEAGILQCGLAFSTDLITWTKYSGNPIFGVGNNGGFDDEKIYACTIVKFGDTPFIYYNAHDGSKEQVGFAQFRRHDFMGPIRRSSLTYQDSESAYINNLILKADPDTLLSLTNQGDIAWTELDVTAAGNGYPPDDVNGVILDIRFESDTAGAYFSLRKKGHTDPEQQHNGYSYAGAEKWVEYPSVFCEVSSDGMIEYAINGAGDADTGINITLVGWTEPG